MIFEGYVASTQKLGVGGTMIHNRCRTCGCPIVCGHYCSRECYAIRLEAIDLDPPFSLEQRMKSGSMRVVLGKKPRLYGGKKLRNSL